VFNAACDKIGRNGSPGQHMKGWVEEAGFTNVHHEVRKVPIGTWARDKKLVSASKAQYYDNMLTRPRNRSAPYID